MIKKIGAFILLAVLASCGTKKPYIQTTKNGTAKNHKTRTATTKRNTAASTANTTKKTNNPVTLESTSRTTVYSEQVQQYVNNYSGIAQKNMKEHGIPASITLAQGILESGAGYGDLSVSANNHFGIKCHTDWTGDKVYHDDDAEQECFRKYEHAEQSFEDHSKFLTTRSRYAGLFKLENDDYKAWAKGLKAAGYATDPKYPDKLISLIERFDLARYDAEVLGKAKPSIDKNVAVKGEVKEVVATKDMNVRNVANREPVVVKPATTASPANNSIQNTAQQSAVNSASAEGTHTVAKGDTLYSISKKYSTTVDELIRLNNLEGNAISIGQVLKVK